MSSSLAPQHWVLTARAGVQVAVMLCVGEQWQHLQKVSEVMAMLLLLSIHQARHSSPALLPQFCLETADLLQYEPKASAPTLQAISELCSYLWAFQGHPLVQNLSVSLLAAQFTAFLLGL